MAFMKKTYNVDPAYEAQMQETDLDFRAHLLKIKSLGADVLAIGGQLDAIARISQQSYRGRHPVQGAPRRGLRRLQRAGARARRRRGGRPDLRGRVQLQGRAPGGAGLRQDGATRSTRSVARTMTSARPTRPRRSSSRRSPARSSTLTDASLKADRARDPRRARQHQELHRTCVGPDQLLRRPDPAVPRRQQDRHPGRVHQGRQGLRHARAGTRVVRARLRPLSRIGRTLRLRRLRRVAGGRR